MGQAEKGAIVENFWPRRIWLLAAFLRILARLYCGEFLSKRAELVVPRNSYRRLADGISMHASGISPYDGDMFHYQPVILHLFAIFIDKPRLILALFVCFKQATSGVQILSINFQQSLAMMDIGIAELLRAVALIYVKKKENMNIIQMKSTADLALLSLSIDFQADELLLCLPVYLLNPVAIGSCAIFSISVLYNFLTTCFLYAFIKGWLLRSALLCSFLTHLELYPVIFLGALIVKYKRVAEKLLVAVVFLVSFAFFFAINYELTRNFDFLDSTYLFLLGVTDLTPNIGIFWYFFIEVFNHFRLFFLWVFQINILVYVFPLLLTIRDNSFLLLHLYLILISVFSSYPSMAENLIYISLIPVFTSLHKYIRWGLLISGTLVTCTVLAPIMWLMWIVIGSANANFYFAVALAYSVAQIFLLTDLLYAYLHKKVTEVRGEDKVKNCACFVLK
ncbi:unnamed protein product [Enterobius vermicularis]|uniref:GPI transamidase subunit PIG-U n=1 Tax=Enterobius vermicularis TaxID=51028 RepID=A0A0N4UWQ3_ENTVE|nr:unnamed protein product [Enterobius vermicularis]